MRILAVLLLFAACAQPAPDAWEVYGEPTLAAAAIAVDAVIADSAAFTGGPVSMSGTVHAVCQMAGCWLTLQSLEGESVRVDVRRTEDGAYAFTVPTDISGRYAVAHGLLKKDEADQATHDHYSEDAGVVLQPARLSMVAEGVMLAPK